MRRVRTTKRFRRDYTKWKRSGKDIRKLHAVMEALVDGSKLDANLRDHALRGAWSHLRDCHIEGDWILLYEVGKNESDEDAVTFHALGTHEQLFG